MSMPVKRGTTQNWIPSIFNDFFTNEWLTRSNATAPAINVFECDKRYTVEVAAPGMKKEDFDIHLTPENALTITMEKNCNCGDNKCECDSKEHNTEKCEEERKGRYLRREFSYTRFQQTLILPDDADTEKIEAKVKHGVLKIHIPKKAKTNENKIDRIIAIE